MEDILQGMGGGGGHVGWIRIEKIPALLLLCAICSFPSPLLPVKCLVCGILPVSSPVNISSRGVAMDACSDRGKHVHAHTHMQRKEDVVCDNVCVCEHGYVLKKMYMNKKINGCVYVCMCVHV